jgi:hypothetical protein
MIGEPPVPWLYQQEAECSSPTKNRRPRLQREETFDWFYDEAQTLRVMPSDEDREGPSAVSQVRQRTESSLSSLWRRFANWVYSRSWHGPQASLLLKILDLNMEHAGISATT